MNEKNIDYLYPQINIKNKYIILRYKNIYGILYLYRCNLINNINKITKIIDKIKEDKYNLVVYIPEKIYNINKNIYEIITAIIYTFIIGKRIKKPELRFLLILTRMHQINEVTRTMSLIDTPNRGYIIIFSRNIEFSGKELVRSICRKYTLIEYGPDKAPPNPSNIKKTLSGIIAHALEIYEG